MNYIRIQELSTAIVEYETALNHIQELAGNLVHNKTGLDIDITIKEAIHEHHNIHAKGNSGEGVETVDFFKAIFGPNVEILNAPKQQKPTHKLSGLSQSGMPPEIALIMLGSIRKWYQSQLDIAKIDLEREMKPERIQLIFDESGVHSPELK